jgi:hypothetical protein
MNCERALLSFGFGRWSRIKEAAAGGTKLRSEYEIAQCGPSTWLSAPETSC